MNIIQLNEIEGSQDKKQVDVVQTNCNAVCNYMWIPTFWRKILPKSSALLRHHTTKHQRQHVYRENLKSLSCCYSNKLILNVSHFYKNETRNEGRFKIKDLRTSGVAAWCKHTLTHAPGKSRHVGALPCSVPRTPCPPSFLPGSTHTISVWVDRHSWSHYKGSNILCVLCTQVCPSASVIPESMSNLSEPSK